MNYLNADLLRKRLFAGDVSNDFGIERDPMFQLLGQTVNRKVWGLYDMRDSAENGYAAIATSRERFVLGASGLDRRTNLPGRIFVGVGDDKELHAWGNIEGPQAFGKPFVGYVETMESFRRQHKATRMLAVMNIASQVCYGEPITSGPPSYLSDDGAQLQEATQLSYGLSTDEQGFVVGVKQ